MKSRKILLLGIVAGLLAGCRGLEAPAATPLPSATVAPSATAEALAAATEATKDAPAARLDGADCLAAGGLVEEFLLESNFLTAGLQVRVYTPPCYTEQPQRNFPVLFLLHGQNYKVDQWDRLGVDEAADGLIAAGETAPFLIVMPHFPSPKQPNTSPFKPAVLEELLPWVLANYRVLAGREYQAIGGLSMGASWALHFGMNYPELFGAMGGHSPPVFINDADHVRTWLAAIPAEQMPRIWLDIGDRDQEKILESAQWFESVLTELDIAHEWHLFTGRHEEPYWSEHVELYLRWYAAEW